MMTLDLDDEFSQFFQEDDSHSRDDDLTKAKNNQIYKDTMLLVKRKMCTAKELLGQCNDKVKEHDDLNLKYHELKIDREKLFNKYNTVSEKLTRLELSTMDCEKSRDEYKYTADNQKIELDEKKKHIEQLEFKIKEMEKDNFYLKDEIKKLKQESKVSKSNTKKATKDKQIQTIRTNQHDVSVNADLIKASPTKPPMRDKKIMTNDDVMPFPVLCSTCGINVTLPPVGEILKIMSLPPPPSLSNEFSPPCSPRSIPSFSQQSESIASNVFDQFYNHENPFSNSLDNNTIEKSKAIQEEPNKPSFMAMDQLIRRISNLEKKVKKEKWKQKKGNSCRPKCCPSKNIQLVLKFPSEEKYLEYAKLGRHKQTHVKRLKKKQIKSKNNKKSQVREWQVESDTETENVKLSLQHSTEQSENKHETLEDNNETDLFDSPAILLSNTTPTTQANLDSPASETMQTIDKESLSMPDENTDKVLVNSTDEGIVCDSKGENVCTMQSSLSNPVLEHTSYSATDIVKQADLKMDCVSDKVFETTNSEHNLNLDVLKNVNSDEKFDLISEILNDTNLSTTESDESEIADPKNEDIICTGIEQEEICDPTLVLNVQSKLDSQENCYETESTLSNIRRISISSTSSSEYDELFSTPTICMIPDKNPQLNNIKQQSEQNSIEEVDNVEKTNISESNDQRNSLTTEEIEKNENIEEIEKNENIEEIEKNENIEEIEEIEKNKNIEEIEKIEESEKIDVIDSPESPSGQIENSVEKPMNIENEIPEFKEDNDHSSDDSINLKCRLAKNKKRGKFSNVIESDDSSEETSKAITNCKNRRKAIATKKRIISKINKLKKSSNYPIISKQTIKAAESQQTIKADEFQLDITDTYIPTKKQRIAHVPKANSEMKEVVSTEQSLQSDKSINEVQKIESENVSPMTKPVNKRVKKTMEDSIQKAKKIKLTRKTQSRLNDENQPAILDHAELESTDVKSLELTNKDENLQPKTETDISEKKQDENNHEESVKEETADKVPKLDLLASQTIMEKTEATENCTNIEQSNIINDSQENIKKEESLGDSKKDSCVETEHEEMVPARNLRGRKVTPQTPERRISRRLQENSPSLAKSDADTNRYKIDIAPIPTHSKKSKKRVRTKANKNQPNIPFDSTNSSLGNTPIVSYFNDFFFGENQHDKEENFEHLKKNETFIRQQLSILIKTEPLTTDVLTQVTEKLLNITPLEIVALVLVEYAATEYLDDVKCNTTYTPPAPPMTRIEQKLVTLISTIQAKEPDFTAAIEKGLQYKLFRLGRPLEMHIVERLFRILIVLNKIKKDREKVRMLLCDALYSYNTRAINIIYIALLCWSEVFPKQDSKNDILVKTIVHIVMSSSINRPHSKLMPLKRLLTDYYGYPNAGYRDENFKLELMDNLRENIQGANTAIILFCKSKGPDWALEYIVRDLKKMIISKVHPSMYDILTLLGDVLRPFSSDNSKTAIQEITDQLCEVLTANPDSHDLQEGIVSCLLNVGGKFSFSREKIAKCVFNWQSNQELRQTTKEKLKSFLKTHNIGWWHKFVQQNFPVAE